MEWIKSHPSEASEKHINMSTQEEFTIKEVLDDFMNANKKGIRFLKKNRLEIYKQIENWLEEL